ncbi:MAG: hypothetical protein Q9P14_05910 [candidate division KSB1 bacterium]|nr:hypothetical protein [candidate division KSB1 bacterium]
MLSMSMKFHLLPQKAEARLARLRNLVNETVLPERRLPGTPSVRRPIATGLHEAAERDGISQKTKLQEMASSKRQVMQLALQGKSVTQIARELDMGVGEVELILGFGGGRPTIPG